jgi:hypothetical protein
LAHGGIDLAGRTLWRNPVRDLRSLLTRCDAAVAKSRHLAARSTTAVAHMRNLCPETLAGLTSGQLVQLIRSRLDVALFAPDAASRRRVARGIEAARSELGRREFM